MNKEQLQARIQHITGEMQNALNTHTALNSHLNECNYWLVEALKLENPVILEEPALEVEEASFEPIEGV